ncbi:MAG TPA: excinuclease ABC subunit UvrC [Vicinamibacterales bacterium]|nr:excinuclease ABC subunit UvrC [Vicinamibacterales bacterium]
MAIDDLKARIARVPQQPGVYLFLNDAGETLYVGKARVLRDRVRSYLGAKGISPRIDALLRDAASLEVVVTDSVVEALALENRLIKQRNPRFNVLLRDDKTYPYLQLTTTERAPRLLVARRVERDGNVYAGPFMPALVARRTMSLAHRFFGIRSCNEIIDGRRDRPCLEYDIHRCLAPCVETICSIERYGRAVDQARLLIEGRQDELIRDLRREMTEAATEEQFERAAHLRDAIRTIETVRDRRNTVETPAMGDRDAFGVRVGSAGGVVTIFQVRRGRVVDRCELTTDGLGTRLVDPLRPEASGGGPRDAAGAGVAATEADLLTAAVQQFYADREPPPEVHIPAELPVEDREMIEGWLTERAGRRVRIQVPRRGDKRGLLDLASRNASLAYQSHFGEGGGLAFEALDQLRDVLALPSFPRRIECFDISTLQGRDTVGAMVVAVDGRMRRGEYRKFKVKGERTINRSIPDDFAAIHEVVLRRYRRVLEHGGPFPDLILIDGGKGQLTAAYAALREVGLDRLVAVGIAKQEELLFTRDRVEGLALPRESGALRLIQRIRDEAHRFAITFHRRSRTKRDLRSALDDVPGVGPRRRRQLLTTFGSVAGVRRASRQDLEAAVGAKTADAVIRHFGG